MKHSLCGLLLFLLAAGTNARTKADGSGAEASPGILGRWAKHDGHELAKIVADDVDFVTVATTYLTAGRTCEKFHLRLLGGRFKESEHHAARDHRAVSAAGSGGCSVQLETRS